MDNGDLDFRKLLEILSQNKKNYLVVLCVSLVLGTIISFSIPKTYTTTIKLAPEASSDSRLGGGLSSISSLVGINMNNINTDAIFPDIYPDVVRSTEFLVNMSRMQVTTEDKKLKTTLFEYMDNYQKQPWWFAISGLFASKAEHSKLNPHKLTKKQANIIEAIENAISCDVDQNTGVITIKASAQDANISAEIADTASSCLQTFITNYRTNKARNDLANIQKLYNEAKERYDKARRKYASYADSNNDLVLESFKAKEADLENEMQLQYNIYTQLTTQLHMARAKVIEKTPVYAIIQPSTVPYKKSAPKRSIIIMAFVFVGCLGYTAYVMMKN